MIRHYRMKLRASLAASIAIAAITPVAPAQAIIVFDPSNYSQNILTAARTLAQINNQIRMLQNQAQSLINQAKNLATFDFPELAAFGQAVQQINQLMGQASAIEFRVAHIDQQFQRMFPSSFDQLLTQAQHASDAQARLAASKAALQQSMTVQAQIVENVQADTNTLNGLASRSQSAGGALQATQATNQLIALLTKQQLQIEQLMAAQYRAQALEQGRGVQAQTDARAATAQFLGSGSAYTPQ